MVKKLGKSIGDMPESISVVHNVGSGSASRHGTALFPEEITNHAWWTKESVVIKHIVMGIVEGGMAGLSELKSMALGGTALMVGTMLDMRHLRG